MEEVPRHASLAPLASCCALRLLGVETEGLLGYQRRAGIIPLCGGTFARSFSVSKLHWVGGCSRGWGWRAGSTAGRGGVFGGRKKSGGGVGEGGSTTGGFALAEFRREILKG